MIEALKAQQSWPSYARRLVLKRHASKAGVATASFVGENASSSETSTIGISLSPKRVTAYPALQAASRSSNYDVENLIRNDLVEAISLKWDAVAIDGSGSDEPSGIWTTPTSTQ